MPTQPQAHAAAPTVRGARRPQPVEPPRVSRLQRLQAEGVEPDLPALSEAAQPLAAWLFELGPLQHGAMAAAPVSWAELQTWQQVAGIELQPWQAQLLRRLSAEYAREGKAAEAPDAPPPMHLQTSAQRRESVARRIGLEFRAMVATSQWSRKGHK